MTQWRIYYDKFLAISPREQYMITITGFVVIIFTLFHFFLDRNLTSITNGKKQIASLAQENKNSQNAINLYKEALAVDPNIDIKNKIAKQKEKLGNIDQELLALTSDLINPIQMRFALLELLKLQKGVSLVSFQVSPAQPLLMPAASSHSEKSATDHNAESSTENNTENDTEVVAVNVENNQEIGLFKHAITLKLKGDYFQLKSYLMSLENMTYTFFWHSFDYQLKEHPVSELEVTLYSLSTKREFVGV